MNVLQLTVLAVGGMVILIGLLFWKQIVSIIIPHKFFKPVIVKYDRSIISPLIYRKGGVSVKYEDNDYLIPKAGLLTQKRVKSGFYREGSDNPIDIMSVAVDMNQEMRKQFEEINLANMFKDRSSINAMLQDYMPFILIGGLALLGFMIYNGNQAVP